MVGKRLGGNREIYMKKGYVYILADKKDGVIYIGVTSDLLKRICEHKNKIVDGFTKNLGVHNLVYYEEYDDNHKAVIREKQMKKWKREWKIRLIEKLNPEWKDLYPDLKN